MKKCLCMLAAVLLLVSCLTGCGSLDQEPAVLGSTLEIPEDGVISASVLQEIQAENSIVAFAGVSNGISYEWLIFGKDIAACKDINLALEISEASSEKIAFRFLSDEDFGFYPALSIAIDTVWRSPEAKLFSGENVSESIADVSITGDETSILKFSPPAQMGAFAILPEGKSPAAQTPTDLQDGVKSSVDDKPVSVTDGKPASGNEATSESQTDGHVLSDGSATEQDQYKTDPVPEGKPLPTEPEDQTVDRKKAYTCSFSIECSTILNHLEDLNPDKLDEVPSSGVIFPKTTVTFYEGESVYDVLQRICAENNIHMEASWTPIYNSAYVEGIHNLYEFDCGTGSGWMYRVDGWYPNYGCSRYQLKQGETVEWRYTCDLGSDIGGGYAMGG